MTDSFPQQLVDRFGRTVSYLRISITDRCDFRCVYCMSEEMTFLPRAQILTLDEIDTLSQAFVELGVRKIRITGGEPLVRRGAVELLARIGRLKGLDELTMTTNGSNLEKMAGDIKKAGVKRINISLDTLDPRKFTEMTRVGDLAMVLRGIEMARKADFGRIKINSVILKGRNHEEVSDLVGFAVDRGFDISFIEEMPLGSVDGHDRAETYYPSERIKADLAHGYELVPTTDSTGGPSRYFRVLGTDSRVGFISPHSNNFCASCNRVRLTVQGRLLLCLGNEHSIDLKRVLRSYPGDLDRVKRAIVDSMAIKPEKHEFDLQKKPIILRHMSVTGG
jgi:cyclic pyranopterin phosphate synthase